MFFFSVGKPRGCEICVYVQKYKSNTWLFLLYGGKYFLFLAILAIWVSVLLLLLFYPPFDQKSDGALVLQKTISLFRRQFHLSSSVKYIAIIMVKVNRVSLFWDKKSKNS